MRYETAAAFRTALELRLRDRSRETGLALGRLRKLVVFERLLARLVIAAPGRWVLKGGLALDFRLGMRARTTKDMDLARRDDVESAMEDLIAAQSLDLGDHYLFRSERVAVPGPEDDATARFRVQAELAGRLFETVLLDIGFSDPQLWDPEYVRPPGLLEFAELGAPDIPLLPIEQHIAEKVHAYTREYTGARPSSRVKDLLDIVIIASFNRLNAARLRTALLETFRTRGTHSAPDSLPLPPEAWERPYAKLARALQLGTDLMEGHQGAALLLDPVLRGAVEGHWDPTRGKWN